MNWTTKDKRETTIANIGIMQLTSAIEKKGV
jgi:hypothetical protein